MRHDLILLRMIFVGILTLSFLMLFMQMSRRDVSAYEVNVLIVRRKFCLFLSLFSLCHKNFNLGHIFFSIDSKPFVFGMHFPCDKTFQTVIWWDFDLWPSGRSNFLIFKEGHFLPIG